MNLRLAVMLAPLMLCSCTIGNVEIDGPLNWHPKPGYQWKEPNGWSFATVWSPGLELTGHQNVVADEIEDSWVPAPGYNWVVGQPNHPMALLGPATVYNGSKSLNDDLRVVWKSGSSHRHMAHIKAANREGWWDADLGYVFVNDKSLAVRWQAGLSYKDKPHEYTGQKEGEWLLEPGYVESFLLLERYVSWKPGIVHPSESCLVAGPQEGNWQPLDGYHIEDPGSGQLRIIENDGGTDWGRFAGGLVLALVGESYARSQDGDGLTETLVARPIAGQVRDAGVKMAVDAIDAGSGKCANRLLDKSWRNMSATKPESEQM